MLKAVLKAGENTSATLTNYNAGTGGLGGYTSYIHTENYIDITVNNALTIECWRKGNNGFYINKSRVFESTDTSLYRYYSTAGGSINSNSISFDSSLIDDNWHFWSYVYGGTYMAIYRDGVLISYTDGLTQNLNSNDNKLYIDAYNLDELRISNVARSPDEIAAYYNAAKSLIVE